MKRIILTTVLVCCTLSLAAQETIRVNYKGAKPTISDFATAFLSVYEWNDDSDDVLDEARNAMKQTWLDYLKGEKLSQDEKLTVDQKNGYICYEYNGDGHQQITEMCYWNEADGKHKLFAYNVRGYSNGTYSPGQFDGLLFYRYDNATKKMTYCEAPGFDEIYGTDDGAYVTYALPRTGKDIIYTEWTDKGKRKQKTLKWNGRKFSF
jgi:hypothetical protein